MFSMASLRLRTLATTSFYALISSNISYILLVCSHMGCRAANLLAFSYQGSHSSYGIKGKGGVEKY